MIIVAIIALSGVVLAILYGILATLPPMPNEIYSSINYMATYFAQGIKFFYIITYSGVIKALFAITVTVEGIIYGYKIAMWVAKKIPMFGVSD